MSYFKHCGVCEKELPTHAPDCPELQPPRERIDPPGSAEPDVFCRKPLDGSIILTCNDRKGHDGPCSNRRRMHG